MPSSGWNLAAAVPVAFIVSDGKIIDAGTDVSGLPIVPNPVFVVDVDGRPNSSIVIIPNAADFGAPKPFLFYILIKFG